ncbi:hypothetical protein Bca52824_053403 [Brassica carinata]|uniref:Uncharacterized protein n=1 Tax=Brassica carinata TaxID=52824 RepID=A0A8X7R8W1_BRACI|nr:hypothetical protein Bca52824_053403 [Brassica carinata]
MPTMRFKLRFGDEFVDAASKGYPENMDIGSNHNESTSEEKDKASSSVEEAWKEHGCVLWDLPTSETHADLMLLVGSKIIEVEEVGRYFFIS